MPLPVKKDRITIKGDHCDYDTAIPETLPVGERRGFIADHWAEWDYWESLTGKKKKENRMKGDDLR
jgi:hypothetical protein